MRWMRGKRWGKRQGHTLVEMLIVVTITGLVASLVIPAMSNDDISKLDGATSVVVDALRFARAEAIRTGESHGVISTVADHRVRVFKLDETDAIPVIKYDVYDPVSKKLYDLSFDNSAEFSGVTLEKSEFDFGGVAEQKNFIVFSPAGTPKFNDGGTMRMLTVSRIRLSLGQHQRDIEVAPVTGRVTVQ